MSTETSQPDGADFRLRVRQRIDALSEARLKVADDFLAYLEERESTEATEELLKLPGFMEELEQAQQQIAAGDVTPALVAGRIAQ